MLKRKFVRKFVKQYPDNPPARSRLWLRGRTIETAVFMQASKINELRDNEHRAKRKPRKPDLHASSDWSNAARQNPRQNSRNQHEHCFLDMHMRIVNAHESSKRSHPSEVRSILYPLGVCRANKSNSEPNEPPQN